VKQLALAGVATAILLAISLVAASSHAEGVSLSPADYVYLEKQGVRQDSPMLQKMSPKELYRLHRLINDERTQHNPKSRTEAVMAALAEFEGQQQWEKANPGHLWDGKKGRASEEAIRK
jgi:hypothetical protein